MLACLRAIVRTFTFNAIELQIMQGAHSARNADASTVRTNILNLCRNDAVNRGWDVLPGGIEKSDRGIKSDCTAQFLLPFDERKEYLKDPAG